MSVNKSSMIRPNRKKHPDRSPRKNGGMGRWYQRYPGLLRAGLPVVGVIIVSFCFLYGYKIITTCNFFGLKIIEVRGIHLLTRQAVMQKAGIAPGDNLLAINLERVRRNLLATPWIGESEISRELPAKITIHIREQVPLAVVDLGKKFIVNEAEQLFKCVESVDPRILPVITGLNYGDLTAEGKPESSVYKASLAAVKTGRKLQHLVPGMNMREVVVDRDRGIGVRGFDNVGEIRLGFENYYNKFDKLKRILQDWENRGKGRRIARMYFLSPERVVVQSATEDS